MDHFLHCKLQQTFILVYIMLTIYKSGKDEGKVSSLYYTNIKPRYHSKEKKPISFHLQISEIVKLQIRVLRTKIESRDKLSRTFQNTIHNVEMLASINRRSFNPDCLAKINYIDFMNSFALCLLLLYCVTET